MAGVHFDLAIFSFFPFATRYANDIIGSGR
jgi:hypothetical protein